MISSVVIAYDEQEADKLAKDIQKYRFETVTTPEGFKFNIPSDMPIERKNGLVTPIPFEEYLYFKFKKIEEKQIESEKKLDSIAELLQQMSKKLDGMVKTQEEILKRSSPAAEQQ